ncbi:MAG: flippase-like domain-containing protein [Gemmatimonadetes bacterium]|nr:flippase-like domain-containing protein [Gemmatimonadota bacterium]
MSTPPAAADPTVQAVASPENAPDRRRAWRRFILRVAASLTLITLLIVFLPFDQLRDAFSRVPLVVFAGAIAIYLCLHITGAMKWRMVVNASGAGLGRLHAVRFYYAGLFGNTFLPSIVGGDVIRAGLALRHVRSKTGLVVGSIVDRFIDILGLACVAGIGVALIPSALDARSRQIFLGVIIGLGMFAAGAVLAGFAMTRRGLSIRARRRLVKLRTAARSMADQPWVVLASLGMGMALQISLVVLTAWLGRFVGIDASLRVWLFVWPLAKISALLPVTQGGLGVREAAQAVLFAPFGVTAVLAVAASLIFQGVIISGGLVGGLLAFLLGRGDPVAAAAVPGRRRAYAANEP